MTCLHEGLTGRGRELWLGRFGSASELLFRVCSFRFAAFSSSFLSASSLLRSCMARSSFCSMSVSCRSCASAVLLTPFWASNSRLQWTVGQTRHPSISTDLWDTSTLLESSTKMSTALWLHLRLAASLCNFCISCCTSGLWPCAACSTAARCLPTSTSYSSSSVANACKVPADRGASAFSACDQSVAHQGSSGVP